ncbi:coniferyl aldehyde dehydrogenase [Solimonas soli]|uniref:coniferyl aldehyde dehydrogenase n=1 Tax=Solimonas soli TaxID=413479 RepID=UPI0004B50F83|nr:coniferyl aldehyde dehydrogenase [Solimonas soli]
MNDALNAGSVESATQTDALRQLLNVQRAAFAAELPVTAKIRLNRLDRLKDMLIRGRNALCDAMQDDFGLRSKHVSLLTDIVCSVRNVRHAADNVERWMKRSRRPLEFPLRLLGAAAWVDYQPKGVVGIVSPWNFPVYLTLTPLSGVLAAGNRALIKPSELTPATSACMATLIKESFDPAEVTVVLGDASVGAAFTALPFDHLVFTGGGTVGRHVMRSASENLVPVTLELGGKSPVIVSRSADVEQAAERIVLGKLLNAGQICLAPDYVLVAREHEESLVSAMQQQARRFYPTYAGNDQYVAIINDRHQARLQSYLDDARARGATLISCTSPGEPALSNTGHRIMPLTIIRGAPPESLVMRNEIFGPLLPIVPFDRIEDAILYINERDRPLGLYYFGIDDRDQREVLARTIAGGVTLNDVISHVMQEDLPLGGIGGSGIGRYHGHDGFLEFSHAKAVYRQARIDVAALLGSKPPYGRKLEKYIENELRTRRANAAGTR